MTRKKAVKSTRTAKSDQVRDDVEAEVDEIRPVPSLERMKDRPKEAVGLRADIYSPESTVEVKADPSAVKLFEGAEELPLKDDLRPDMDLLEEQKEEFKRILDKKLTLAQRGDLLVSLAQKTGNKTAPVALRAIQVINEITGVTQQTDSEAPSMFTLPEGVKVSVSVETPEK